MENMIEEMFKLMNLPAKATSQYYELMEKGNKAMISMAAAQTDMAEFQEAWEEFQKLNPLLKK
tara:strand:- start:1354 stop:1542 length:189 start_codon:yes stop_codon:yes gene_type:complete